MPGSRSSTLSWWGTGISLVSADPPKARRSISITTWSATSMDAATFASGGNFDVVALAVAETQRVRPVPFRNGDSEDGGRIEPTAQEHHGRRSLWLCAQKGSSSNVCRWVVAPRLRSLALPSGSADYVGWAPANCWSSAPGPGRGL